MMPYKAALVFAISVVSLSAATPPLQAVSGPGGSQSVFTSVTVSGPFNDGPSCPGHECNQGLTYYIYQPVTSNSQTTLPVILFLHGYSADNPNGYLAWIQHIALRGYTVVWTNWDDYGTATGDVVISNELTSFQNAITRIQNDKSYVQLATNKKGVVRAAIAGHSAGAFTGFRVASLSWDASNGIPPIRAIAAINPGQGNLPDYDVSAIDPSTMAVVVVGADESTCEQYVGAKLYDLIPMVPTSSKSFLEAFTDNHGSPGLSSEHNFPATLAPKFALDDMDFNVSFKLSVALFDCTFYGTYCPNAVEDTTSQTSMGKWSDGVPVTPLSHFTTDPQLTFPVPAGCTE